LPLATDRFDTLKRCLSGQISDVKTRSSAIADKPRDAAIADKLAIADKPRDAGL